MTSSADRRRDHYERLTLPPEEYERRKQRTEEQANAWRTCAHRYDNSRWAGILGWRTECSKCWHMFVPHDHTANDGCEKHPERNGWDEVDLPLAEGPER